MTFGIQSIGIRIAAITPGLKLSKLSISLVISMFLFNVGQDLRLNSNSIRDEMKIVENNYVEVI